MIHRKQNINRAILFAILLLGVFPALKAGNVSVPIQYILTPFLLLTVATIFTGGVKVSYAVRSLIHLWLLVISEVIVSSIFGPAYAFGEYVFPRENVQYIVRFIFFLYFYILFNKSDSLSEKYFIKYFLIVLLIGMAIGIVQWLPWSGAGKLAEAYTYKDENVQLTIADVLYKRVPGIAGMATANGGIAAFAFTVALVSYCYVENLRKISIIIMCLAIANTMASQARMGYLTIAFSLFVFYFAWTYVKRRFIKPTIYLSSAVALILICIFYLYQQGNPFIYHVIQRWVHLNEQVYYGGNRIGQVVNAFSKLEGVYDYLFGISRYVQQSYGYLYIEIEPVNIFVMYGILGFVLQYSLVSALALYFVRQWKYVKHHPLFSCLTAASLLSLISYQFFSLAYFFFRETYVGLFPWILMGASIGMIEKHKRRAVQQQFPHTS